MEASICVESKVAGIFVSIVCSHFQEKRKVDSTESVQAEQTC